MLSKEELAEFAKSSYVTIGSHGFDHYLLSEIDKKQRFDELSQSKKILEEVIQKPITMLAYPDGNYSDDVIREAKEIGYEYQFAV